MPKVYIFKGDRFETKKVFDWCKQQFGELTKIHSPTTAELHRISYDNSINGIVVFYFRDERDYLLFSLRWV